MATTPNEARIGTGKLTYDDLVSLADETRRYEIFDGDLVVTASPTTRHQRVSRNLAFILHDYVSTPGLGEVFYAPVDVILDRHTVVVPDLVYVSKARTSIVQPHAIVGAPDLLVEILSPSTADRDWGAKAKLYARFGVDHDWVVDPDERILTVFSRTRAAYAEAARHARDATVRAAPFSALDLDLGTVWA